MLCAERVKDHAIVRADEELSEKDFYVCPDCQESVSLKKSKIRLSHFSHSKSSSCVSNTPESEAHRRCKLEIFEALLKQPGVKRPALERHLKTCRPDVSAWINGVPVAIEVQLSSLTVERIMQRTREYTNKGIYVLWVLPWTPYLDSNRYSPSMWEKWLHTLYYGRVYYWKQGLEIWSYRFEPFLTRIAGGVWKTPLGQRKVKSFRKRSKRFAIPFRSEVLNLVQDFVGYVRSGAVIGNFMMPRSRLFIGKLSRRQEESDNSANRTY